MEHKTFCFLDKELAAKCSYALISMKKFQKEKNTESKKHSLKMSEASPRLFQSLCRDEVCHIIN
jgi:hypothetical protein